MPVAEIREGLEAIRAVCRVVPITGETHDRGLRIVERCGVSTYDAMIAASALLAECNTIVSEDMQDGLVLDGRAEVRNPFR